MDVFAALMSPMARPGSQNPEGGLWRSLCLLLAVLVLVGGSTPAPQDVQSTLSTWEDWNGTTVHLQPDLQTEVQTQTENPTDPPTPRSTSNYTG